MYTVVCLTLQLEYLYSTPEGMNVYVCVIERELTTVVREPAGTEVEWWTDVEDVGIGALAQVRDAQL